MRKLLFTVFLSSFISCELRNDCEACEKCIEEISQIRDRLVDQIQYHIKNKHLYEPRQIRYFPRDNFSELIDQKTLSYNMEFYYLSGKHNQTKQILKIIAKNHPNLLE